MKKILVLINDYKVSATKDYINTDTLVFAYDDKLSSIYANYIMTQTNAPIFIAHN